MVGVCRYLDRFQSFIIQPKIPDRFSYLIFCFPKTCLSCLILLGFLSTQLSSEEAPMDYSKLDWLRYNEMTSEQQRGTKFYCRGDFIDPLASYVKNYRISDQVKYPVSIKAELLKQKDGDVIEAEGRVEMTQNLFQIKSDYLLYQGDEQKGALEGNVVVRQPDLLVLADSGRADMRSGEFWLNDNNFVMHSETLYGESSELFSNSSGRIRLSDPVITRCDPEYPVWEVSASRLTLKPVQGIATSTHSVIKVKGVPVFYLPYFRFPIDDKRHTGFLAPVMEVQGDKTRVQLPFYWNIAPNLDTTMTPHFLEDQGEILDSEWRYLTKASEGSIIGTIEQTNQETEDEDWEEVLTEEQQENNRWWYSFTHKHDLNKQARLQLDIADASDAYFFKHYQDKDDTTDALNQSVKLIQNYGSWNHTTTVQRYSIINQDEAPVDQPYARQPSHRVKKTWGGKAFQSGITLDSELAYFTRNLNKSELEGISSSNVKSAEGSRWHTKLGFSYPLEWPFAFIKPQVNLLATQYNLVNTSDEMESNPTRFMTQTSLDTGLIFERNIESKDNWTQTLEPRVFYTQTPFEEQSDLPLFDTSVIDFSQSTLYRSDRFNGGDRVGDMERVTVGLSSKIYDDTNKQIFKISADQLYFLSPERTGQTSTLTPESDEIERSLLFVGADWALSNYWNTGARYKWDWEAAAREGMNFWLRYRPRTRAVFNLDLATEGQDLDKEDSASASFVLPFAQRWGLIGIHEWTKNHEEIAETASSSWLGFEFDDCCWNTRLLVSHEESEIGEEREVEERKILFQITLKGLGSPGEALENLLVEEIDGYKGNLYR